MIGQEFGRLTVVKYIEFRKKSRNHFWECRCECGTIVQVSQGHLKTGHTKSCGCIGKERMHSPDNPNYKHGLSHSPEWSTWQRILQVTQNPRSTGYYKYGGRGIKCCQRWLDSFDAFFADMGKRPTPRHQIEREDNNGDYCPENCVWALPTVQANNTRRNRRITYQGKTQSLKQWCDEINVNYAMALQRIIKLKWNPVRAITQPKLSKAAVAKTASSARWSTSRRASGKTLKAKRSSRD